MWCIHFVLSVFHVSLSRIDGHSILYDCTVGLLIIDAANYTFDPLHVFIPSKYTITMSKSDSINDSLVSHILYRVPKKNHDAMLKLCKEAYDMLKQHGILHYDIFQLSNTDVSMDGFDNIANTVSANQDEEVWVESIYYKDRQHMNEVMSKMEKDERMGESMKQSMALLPPGAKFIMGEFERLVF